MKRPTLTAEREAARLEKMRGIVQFFRRLLWKGDLSEMRQDGRVPRVPVSPKKN